jgi:ribosomal protein L16 Arg81 hydroxylase
VKLKRQFDEGFKAGAEAERKRIQSVEEQTLPGHEALIAKLKFDGHTTAQQAAVQVLAAERKKRLAMTDPDLTKVEQKLAIVFRNTAARGKSEAD